MGENLSSGLPTMGKPSQILTGFQLPLSVPNESQTLAERRIAVDEESADSPTTGRFSVLASRFVETSSKNIPDENRV